MKMWSDAELQKVAKTYLEVNICSAQHVADVFGIPVRNTDYPIREARRRGLLPPSNRTRRETDADGNVKCLACGEFKPLDAMAADGHGRHKKNLCKPCHHRRRRLRDKELGRPKWRDQRKEWARHRALEALATKHPEEFEALMATLLKEAENVELLGLQEVRAHLRAVYGHPATDGQREITRA